MIKTVKDWRELAAKTIPLLPVYAAKFKTSFDADRATTLYQERKERALHGMFEMLWARLPERADIRIDPFVDLCMLCSESWVLYDVLQKENR